MQLLKAGMPCKDCGIPHSRAVISPWPSARSDKNSRRTQPTTDLHSMSRLRDEARSLHPILRDEVYKIAAEALRNAFRHSRARRVEVEIRYDNEQFRLRIRDDGKGIDPALLSEPGP